MDFQLVIIGILGALAVFILYKKVRATFAKDGLCDQGCGCAVTEIRNAQSKK